MKIDTRPLVLAAAALAGLLSGCATHEQKKECKKCEMTKGEKANCGAKANCTSKHTCRGKGNCGARQ